MFHLGILELAEFSFRSLKLFHSYYIFQRTYSVNGSHNYLGCSRVLVGHVSRVLVGVHSVKKVSFFSCSHSWGS